MINTNIVPDELVSKVRKLLSLSKSDNPNEAELAMSKAKKLAVEYDLDLSSIDIHDKQKPEPIVKGDSIQLGKREPTCGKYIQWILTTHFNVRIIRSGGRYFGRSMTFIGRKQDIELSKYVWDFLNAELPRLWHRYYAQNPEVGIQGKQSFLFGCYQGINSKLTETKKTTEEERFNSIPSLEELEKVKNNYSLMVVSHKNQLENAVMDYYPNLRKATNIRINLNCDNARSEGFKVGKNVNLNKPLQNFNQKYIN